MLWTTAAVAAHPSCRSLDRRKKPLPCGQQEEELKAHLLYVGCFKAKKDRTAIFLLSRLQPVAD